MTFRAAIGMYLRDAEADGRIASRETVRTYLSRLERLADHVRNRSPHTVSKGDIQAVLRTWPNPATQAHALSIFVSFFDWCEKDNEPSLVQINQARKIRRPRVKRNERYKFTLDETVRVLGAAKPGREEWVVHLGVFAGLRNAEMRGLQGRHFRRPGWIWVSRDIGKGNVERWIPVLNELRPVDAQIRGKVADKDYVLPGRGGRRMSTQTLCAIAQTVAARAGITADVGAHTLRHAFTDYVRRATGDVAIAQALLGHASMQTTQGYMSKPSLDELRAALGLAPATPPLNGPQQPITAGISANESSHFSAAPSDELWWLWAWLGRQMEAIEAYKEAFAR